MKKSKLFITLIALAAAGAGTYYYFLNLGAKQSAQKVVTETPTNPLLLETAPHMEEAFPAIATFWDDQELLKRASPYLQAIEEKEKQTPGFFKIFRQIGDLKTNKGCQFLTGNNAEIPFADPTTAPKVNVAYSCTGGFEKGDASIQFVLSKVEDKWQISSYRVFSPYLESLVKPKAQPTTAEAPTPKTEEKKEPAPKP